MYDLEMVTTSERIDRTLELLQQDFPTLRFSTKSRMFVIFWGVIPFPLNEDEKVLLESYIEQKVILRWRCKQQKEYGR